MATGIPITSDLFRFITVKPPNLITTERKEQVLISHPDFNRSFIAPLIAEGENVTKQMIISAYSADAMKSLSEVIQFSPELYRYAENKFQTTEGEGTPEPLRDDQALIIWDNILYQAVAKVDAHVRQGCINLLKASKKVSSTANRGFGDIVLQNDQDFVVIPKDLVGIFDRWYLEGCNGKLYGVKNLGVADYRRVEQEICCYVPGEVSHIENILAKEYKEKSTRNLVKSEVSVETLRESEIEQIKDTATTTRNELHSEIASVVEQQRNIDVGANIGYSSTLGSAGTINANASFGFASSNSSSLSNMAAKEYAQEVVSKAIDRILQRTSERRTSRIIKEFEENNKHGFDNRDGNEHVTGIYRWVDIIYKNRIVNYGKRLMLEFMVPEPAMFYKNILKYKPVDPEGQTTEEEIENARPKTLQELGINSATDITRSNYLTLAANYGISLNAPLDETIVENKAFIVPCPKNGDNSSKTHKETITINPDYEAESAIGKADINYTRTTGPHPKFKIDIGSFTTAMPGGLSGRKKQFVLNFAPIFNPKYSPSFDVNFDYMKINSCSVNMDVTCKLKASKFLEWQNDCYQKLLTAFQNANTAFENTLDPDDEENTATEKKYRNPALNRVIEQRELKRLCIEMVTEPFCRHIGENYIIEEIDVCDNKYVIPHVAQSQLYEDYITQVKFLEQAIDWQLMSYLFYPYYWGDKCRWGDLMQSEDDDLLFQAFLQSGMGRVVVPVRLEMTEAALYYLRTGEIWTGGDLIPGTNDDLYISIMDEMQEPLGTIEGSEWETRLPSTLTIVQDKSAKLEETGLPCCHEDDPLNPNPIKESTNVLSLLPPTP